LPPSFAIAAPSGPPNDPNALQIDQLTLKSLKEKSELVGTSKLWSKQGQLSPDWPAPFSASVFGSKSK